MAQRLHQARSTNSPQRRTGRRRTAIAVKRVYEPASSEDGARVLVDRLWPRGLSREKAGLQLWLKDVAPSDALRRWYGHKPERWPAFAEKYRKEFAGHADMLHQIDALRAKGRVTLLYGARDPERNNAVVLRDVLEARR